MLPAVVLLLAIPFGGYIVAMFLFGSAGRFAGFIKRKYDAYRRVNPYKL